MTPTMNPPAAKTPVVASFPTPVQPNPSSTTTAESNRRPSQQQSSVSSQSIPRKIQASRKQHRNMRRPGSNQRSQSHGPDIRINDHDYDLAEMRAVRNPTSRRGQTSITHLLNYTVSPSPGFHDSRRPAYSTNYRRHPTWGPGSGYHANDKARYVHANYRFVVSPHSTYAAHAADADKFLDWSDVLQVIASAESQPASCPICLSEPVAPRMAKCGHIFCLSCFLRFMDSGREDEAEAAKRRQGQANGAGGWSANNSAKQSRWKHCPICEDSIGISEVRPVRFYVGQECTLPRVGQDVILRLMVRYADSTLALPRSSGTDWMEASKTDVPWHFAANALDYAHIVKGTTAYMTEQFDEEVEAIKKSEQEDILLYNDDDTWTRKAVRAIATAKKMMEEMEQVIGESIVTAGNDQPKQNGGNSHQNNNSTTTNKRRGSSGSGSRNHNPDFFFYTSLPHLYLSPLDIRILKTTYGSFSLFPSTLLPRVEHISTGHVVDDALRRRAKYLSHLPQGCLVSFLECDWTDIVPAETLEAFAVDIERRRKRNMDNLMQEDRMKQEAERIETAQLRREIDGRNSRDRDSWKRANNWLEGDGYSSSVLDMSEFEPLVRHRASGGEVEGNGGGIFLEEDETEAGNHGGSPPRYRAGFAQLADVSTSPTANRTVWGTRAIAAAAALDAEGGDMVRYSGNKDDGWLNDPSLYGGGGGGVGGDDTHLAMQMESMGITASAAGGASSSSAAAAAVAAGGKKKGKKKQKITLMSTGGKRGI